MIQYKPKRQWHTHMPQCNIWYDPICNLNGRALMKILEITVTGTHRVLLPKISLTCYGVRLIPTLWRDEWLRVFCVLLRVKGRCGLLLCCKYEASFKVTVTNGGCLPAIHMRCYGNSQTRNRLPAAETSHTKRRRPLRHTTSANEHRLKATEMLARLHRLAYTHFLPTNAALCVG